MSQAAARQLLVLGAALSLWAAWAEPSLRALALSYAAAALLLGWLGLASYARAQRPRVLVAISLLGLVPGGAALVRAWPALLEREGIATVVASFADRWRLEQQPSIAPALLSSEEPQTFFVRAEHARVVRARLAPGIREREAESLGQGVFRIDYDPRRDGVAQRADGPVAASLIVDGEVHERELEAVTALAHPRWLCVAPDGARAATVSRETDELFVVSSRGLERRVAVGDAPSDCAFIDASRVAVSHENDTAVWLADTASGQAGPRWRIGARQGRLALSPDSTALAVARSGLEPELVVLSLIGDRADAATKRVALPSAPDWLAFGSDASVLVVATRSDAAVHRVRLGEHGGHIEQTRKLGRPAVCLARGAGGSHVFVATTDVRPDGRAHLGNHFVQDQLLEIEIASLEVTRSLLTARRTPRQTRAGDVDSGLSPMGISARRQGGLLVAFAGSDELWELPRFDQEPTRIDLRPAEILAPHGVAELIDGSRIVSSPSQGLIAVFAPGRSTANAKLLRFAPDDAWLAKRAPQALARRRGEHGFYEATRSGISCQNCHMHADSDLAAHNLGDRKLLPTLSVRGLLATAPYLRDGTYGHLHQLDYVAQVLYRGYLRRMPARAELLERYLASLTRIPSARLPHERAQDAQARGLRVFMNAGCPSCHAPPAFSSLGQHRPLALFPSSDEHGPYELLDAPSLLSIGATAPYLSDGRAKTLAAVLDEHNRDNHHGDTARLSAAERRDLVSFLEAL